MSDVETYIARVNNKLQLLLKLYTSLKKENEKLKQRLNQKEQEEKITEEKIKQLQQQNEIAAAMSGVQDEKIKNELEKRINTYIREIDQCIAALQNQ
jgi:regulator of replication initiation timing